MFPFLSAPMFYAVLMALIGALCLGAEIHGHSRGVDDTEQRYAAARAEQEHEARMFEQARATKLQESDDAKNAELRRVGALADSLAGELRNRPSRVSLPGTAPAACPGGTGATLYREDAIFLLGEATRADSLRAELGACQERERAADSTSTPEAVSR